jgi:hypothetical protein
LLKNTDFSLGPTNAMLFSSFIYLPPFCVCALCCRPFSPVVSFQATWNPGRTGLMDTHPMTGDRVPITILLSQPLSPNLTKWASRPPMQHTCNWDYLIIMNTSSSLPLIPPLFTPKALVCIRKKGRSALFAPWHACAALITLSVLHHYSSLYWHIGVRGQTWYMELLELGLGLELQLH